MAVMQAALVFLSIACTAQGNLLRASRSDPVEVDKPWLNPAYQQSLASPPKALDDETTKLAATSVTLNSDLDLHSASSQSKVKVQTLWSKDSLKCDGLPAKCCVGGFLDKEHAYSCECNPGWSEQECLCKAYLMEMPCDHCMVSLPEHKKVSFTKHELFTGCNNCITDCKADFAAGECKDFTEDIFNTKFPDGPSKALCAAEIDDFLPESIQDEFDMGAFSADKMLHPEPKDSDERKEMSSHNPLNKFDKFTESETLGLTEGADAGQH